MSKKPTVPQMLNRANSGHYQVARDIANGATSLDAPGMSIATLRGRMTVYNTLCNWGVVEDKQITEIGRQFIAAYEERLQSFRGAA